jgi:hypothetical protein
MWEVFKVDRKWVCGIYSAKAEVCWDIRSHLPESELIIIARCGKIEEPPYSISSK